MFAEPFYSNGCLLASQEQITEKNKFIYALDEY
jgi:hypothetical protein